MTQKELIGKIKAEIERRIIEWQALLDKGNASKPDAVKELICEDKNLLFFIESLEQSIDADKMIGLDEAARSICDELYLKEGKRDPYGNPYFLPDALMQAVFAGAEWMAEQGVLYETTISADKTIPALPMTDVSNLGLDYGDKVIVQIRKK